MNKTKAEDLDVFFFLHIWNLSCIMSEAESQTKMRMKSLMLIPDPILLATCDSLLTMVFICIQWNLGLQTQLIMYKLVYYQNVISVYNLTLQR